MAVKTLPLELPLVIYNGTSFRRDFRWRPEGGTGVDFTGWSAAFVVGGYQLAPILTITSGPATAKGALTLTNDGIIRIQLAPAYTATLEPTGSDALAYQLDLTDPDGFVLRFLRGRVEVVQDVDTTL